MSKVPRFMAKLWVKDTIKVYEEHLNGGNVTK